LAASLWICGWTWFLGGRQVRSQLQHNSSNGGKRGGSSNNSNNSNNNSNSNNANNSS
jgi:hypothetical protein